MQLKNITSPLENIITSLIKKNTFITVENFIDLCLNHPEYGYYINTLPIGKKQDFITAPEISQLFGEMLAFWLINHWERLNKSCINLIEIGPGNGTLMLDLINIIKKLPLLASSISIYLVEINKSLIQTQQHHLLDIAKQHNIKIEWLKDIYQTKEIVYTNKHPVIIIANEFLDVLPVKQFKYTKSKWHEVIITLDKNSNFSLALNNKSTNIQHLLPKNFIPKLDMIFEYSPLSLHYIKLIGEIILQNKGAAAFIDYGYLKNPYTNTIQAIKNHKYTNFLNNIGKNDITSLVNFPLLLQVLQNMNLNTYITTQEKFLTNLGISQRMDILLKIAKSSQKDAIISGAQRILDKNNMGTLFKVLEIT